MNPESVSITSEKEESKEESVIPKEESKEESAVPKEESKIEESVIPKKKQPKLFPHKLVATFTSVNDFPKIELAEERVNIAAYVPLGVYSVGASRMWNLGITGKDVIVAIIDTGILNHPDLANKVVISRNYTGETFPPQHVHGTHVSGTVAANGNIRGVAFEAKLGDYRVLDATGSGDFDWIVAAIYDAVRDGCQVINMSLGGPFDYPPLRSAIQYAYSMNVPVIVAAGNEGDGNVTSDEYSYPAMYPTTESIGAASYNKSATQPAYFTNTNSEVDCCCQGVQVISTGGNGTYLAMSGTSMACPHIAGVAALLIHKKIQARQIYNTAEIYAEIVNLAKDIYYPGVDNATGKGYITFNPTL